MSRARDIADGTLNSADINGGTIDGTDITVGSGKTLNVSAGTLTTSTAQKEDIVDNGKANLAASDVGLGNVTNESKETMFTNPTFTGTITASSLTAATALTFNRFPHINTGHSLLQRYFEWYGPISSGQAINLLSNTSAYLDVHFIGVIEAHHGGRTYSMQVGTFGGYGLQTAASNGNAGGVNFTNYSSAGIGTFSVYNSSASGATAWIGVLLFGNSGVSVLNGTLYT